MLTGIDNLINRITTYRLVLYVLIALVGVATIVSAVGLLPFTPVALLVSSTVLVGICWATNVILSSIFGIPANIESAAITGLILALIIDPARSGIDVQILGWAAILAMASKYILSINNKHIFNPAAIAVVITGVALGSSASWWVGTTIMLLPMLVGGWLIVRKVRQEDMVLTFLGTSLITVVLASVVQSSSILQQLQQLVLQSPLIFFATIMLTEPLTSPPTRDLKRAYAVMVGVLFVPQVHLGGIYFTPELALVLGNIFAYVVSSKQRIVLKLRKKYKVSQDVVDFVFAPSQALAFAPGQYMEFTLDHPHPDTRGNRRYFTIASSPTEADVHVGVRFYDQGSSFKRALYGIDGRAKLLGAQIAGDFTLPRDPQQKLAFIAGGIGITPFRSMLKYLLDTQERRDIVVIYANRTTKEIAYRDVLNEAQERLGIKTMYTLTDLTAIPANWGAGKGRIDHRMIRAAVPDYDERVFYISGPPEMVTSCEEVLRSLGVPREHIKKDFFPGLV